MTTPSPDHPGIPERPIDFPDIMDRRVTKLSELEPHERIRASAELVELAVKRAEIADYDMFDAPMPKYQGDPVMKFEDGEEIHLNDLEHPFKGKSGS